MSVWRRLGLLPLLLALLGALALVGSASAAAVYPVKVGPTGRYLVDQAGAPFLMVGESPQALIGNLSLADAQTFFINRKSHGFNTVWINLLCAAYTACRADGATYDGIAPFTALLNTTQTDRDAPNYDFATPNEAYFAKVDQVLQLAAQYGFLVILDPAETGSWLTPMMTNGADKTRAYGQYLGQRYKNFDNIVWMHGNDYHFDQPPTADLDQVTTALALGIKDVDTRHLQTIELYYLQSSSTDDPRWVPLIDLNAAYTYFPAYDEVLNDYNRQSILPVFLVESGYEFEDPPGVGTAPKNLRAQEYWTVLSGATGQLYGNHYTWQFIDGWQQQLDSPGAIQMGLLNALFAPRAWHLLVPDQGHVLVTAGIGTFGDVDYVTAAQTPDGTLAMAYVPTSRTLTVDLSRLSGQVTARWYDPAVGTFSPVPGSPFANAGSYNFTTPGNNAGGDQDWVLVLEVRAPSDTTPPTVSITSPTTDATYITSSALVTLGGTASDDVGVTQVTWTNGRGGGMATGTTSWVASDIPLKLGLNVLTVTARDAAGHTGTASLSVCRTAVGRVGGVLCH